MLRITVIAEAPARVVMTLEGTIDAEGAALLESECAALLATGASIALDFRAVRFVDRAGTEALGRLWRAGVSIRCPGGVLASVLESAGIGIHQVFRDE